MSGDRNQTVRAFAQFDRERSEQQGPGIGVALVERTSDLFDGSPTINSLASGVKVTAGIRTA